MKKYLLILFLLTTYSIFAQKQYEVREAGYWPIEHPIERYWITKFNNIKVADLIDLKMNELFFYLNHDGNEGYYYSLTSVIDGTKVMAVYLILDHIFGY